MKATIKVPAVLSCALEPCPVIVATVAQGRGPRPSYVHLTQQELETVELGLLRPVHQSWLGLSITADCAAFTAYTETAIDVEARTCTPEDVGMGASRRLSGRHLTSRGNAWVDVALAGPLLDALRAWQAANPYDPNRLWAPGWTNYTVVRKFAVAAGRLAEVLDKPAAPAEAVAR